MRKGDLPKHKETIMSDLFGQFIGFLKNEGLTKGNEFETRVIEVFDCSKKIIWLDKISEKYQMTIYLNSVHMFIEYGVVEKKNKEVVYREKLEDLRYNMSEGSELALIPAHQKKFDKVLEKIKGLFIAIKDDKKIPAK